MNEKLAAYFAGTADTKTEKDVANQLRDRGSEASATARALCVGLSAIQREIALANEGGLEVVSARKTTTNWAPWRRRANKVAIHLIVITVAIPIVLGAGKAFEHDPDTLTNIEEVTAAAAKIVERPDGELSCAVDVPAYGDISATKQFELYERAWQSRMTSPAARNTDVIWYSRSDEQHYLTEDSKTSSTEPLKNSDRIRRLVHEQANITEAKWPSMNAMQLWIWSDGKGQFEGIVAFVDKASIKAEVHGRHFAFHEGDKNELGRSYLEWFQAIRKSSQGYASEK
jgi:hypothetical protein